MKPDKKAVIYSLLIGLSCIILTCAANKEVIRYRNYMDSSLNDYWRDFPVLATMYGIHDYDDMIPDISEEAFANHHLQAVQEMEFMESLDTTGWNIDEKIDFELEYRNLQYQLADTGKYDLTGISPAYYTEICVNGIIFPYIQDPDFSDHTCNSIVERIRKVPEFLNRAKDELNNPIWGYLKYSDYLSSLLTQVIGRSCVEIIDKYPERNAEISTIRDKAILALRDFQDYCTGHIRENDINYSIGKNKLKLILKTQYFIDMDLTEIEQIADSLFTEADSMVRSYKNKEKLESESFGISDVHISPEWDSIKAYASYELNKMAHELDSLRLFHVSKTRISIRYEKKPQFFNLVGIDDDIFEPPGIFDTNQTGVYYMEQSLRWDYDESSKFTVGPNKDFKFNLAKNIVPGIYSVNQKSIAGGVDSRMLQDNLMFITGWGPYTKELLLNSGLLDCTSRDMLDFYTEVRKDALCALIEIKTGTGEFDFTEARRFADEKLHEDSTSFSDNSILFAMIIPALQGIAPTFGRYYFKSMLNKAKFIEGNGFNYADFHDKILCEGKIPPILIARKYGWE